MLKGFFRPFLTAGNRTNTSFCSITVFPPIARSSLFAILEPQNPASDVSGLHKVCGSTDYGALESSHFWSGSSSNCTLMEAILDALEIEDSEEGFSLMLLCEREYF